MPDEFDRPDIEGLDWKCPYCGITVALKPMKGVPAFDVLDRNKLFLICRCPRNQCREKIVFVIYDNHNRCIETAYPFPDTSLSSWSDSIPVAVREDTAEAARCYYTRAFKGVVVMCRRALQNVAKDKKIEAKELKDQIKEMRANGLITENLFDASHEIRHFGGYGAHPQDDQLDDITRADADSVFDFLNQILNDIYVMPARTKELAQKRQQVR
jgi:hypothetical protein